MVKSIVIALAVTLTTVFSSILANPAIAAEMDELASVTADRDNLRSRLSNAIAYSKARGKNLAETEMQLAKSMEERKALADRLRRAIAVSKERGRKLEAAEMQLSKSMADHKVSADRLRRAIAVSKERGVKLASSDASRKQTEDRLRRAIAVSKERGAKLASSDASRKQAEDRLRRAIAVSKERGAKLANSDASRKQAENRLRRAISVSKERGAKLANSDAKRKQTENRLRRAIAHSKSTRSNFEEQLANSSDRKSDDWVAQVGASLQANIGGLEGTQIVENYDDNTVKLQLGNTGLFSRAGTALSGSGKTLLSTIAQQLMEQDASLTVVGHTDSIPVGQGGRYSNNEELSFARSMSALQFLREQGIPKEQLSAAGHGADSPIASNDTTEGRQQNRRVEIVLRSK